jgi:hypothetical protein
MKYLNNYKTKLNEISTELKYRLVGGLTGGAVGLANSQLVKLLYSKQREELLNELNKCKNDKCKDEYTEKLNKLKKKFSRDVTLNIAGGVIAGSAIGRLTGKQREEIIDLRNRYEYHNKTS